MDDYFLANAKFTLPWRLFGLDLDGSVFVFGENLGDEDYQHRLGYPMPGVVVSVCRIAVLYIPIALVAMRFFDIAGIFAAYAIANIVSGLGAYAWARRTVRTRCAEEAVLREAIAETRP